MGVKMEIDIDDVAHIWFSVHKFTRGKNKGTSVIKTELTTRGCGCCSDNIEKFCDEEQARKFLDLKVKELKEDITWLKKNFNDTLEDLKNEKLTK